MKKIISLVIVLAFVKFSFCQWTTLTSGTNEYLRSIQFINTNVGYCSTDGGSVLKTTNAGLNWNTVGNCLAQKILFLDVDTGFSYWAYDLFSPSYDLYKTTDGGVTWNNKLSSNTGGFFALHFPLASIGYTASKNFGSDSLYVHKTVDYGENWYVVSIIPVDAQAFSIFFLDASTGFLATDNYGRIYRTTDGGVNWNVVFTTALSPTNDIFFPTPLLGYAAGSSDYKKTTDGGLTWTETAVPFSPLFYAVDCPSANNCHIVGGTGTGTGTLIKTINGGTNWTQTGITATTYTDVDFLNDSTGYACGANGSIIKYSTSIASIQEYQHENFELYPNPATNFTTLSFDNLMEENFNVIVYNCHGEVVKEINSNTNNIRIDLDGLASGLYNIHLYSSSKGFKSRKLTLE